MEPFWKSEEYQENRRRKYRENREVKEERSLKYIRQRSPAWENLIPHLDFWFEHFKTQKFYHLIVNDVDVVPIWLKYCREMPFKCDCVGDSERLHYHYLMMTKAEKCVQGAIKVKICRDLPKANGRRYYSRKINSRVHLINCILYIQTREVLGFAHNCKELKCSEHKNHSYTACILEDNRERKALLNMWNNPVFQQEAKLEWEMYKNK